MNAPVRNSNLVVSDVANTQSDWVYILWQNEYTYVAFVMPKNFNWTRIHNLFINLGDPDREYIEYLEASWFPLAVGTSRTDVVRQLTEVFDKIPHRYLTQYRTVLSHYWDSIYDNVAGVYVPPTWGEVLLHCEEGILRNLSTVTEE